MMGTLAELHVLEDSKRVVVNCFHRGAQGLLAVRQPLMLPLTSAIRCTCLLRNGRSWRTGTALARHAEPQWEMKATNDASLVWRETPHADHLVQASALGLGEAGHMEGEAGRA